MTINKTTRLCALCATQPGMSKLIQVDNIMRIGMCEQCGRQRYTWECFESAEEPEED